LKTLNCRRHLSRPRHCPRFLYHRTLNLIKRLHMTQRYVVPNIYQDISDQSQGYFAFRFCCQECYWSVDTRPIRSTVSTISNVMDIGVGLLGGFWGRAAQAGEQMYGSKWPTE